MMFQSHMCLTNQEFMTVSFSEGVSLIVAHQRFHSGYTHGITLWFLYESRMDIFIYIIIYSLFIPWIILVAYKQWHKLCFCSWMHPIENWPVDQIDTLPNFVALISRRDKMFWSECSKMYKYSALVNGIWYMMSLRAVPGKRLTVGY